MTRIVTLGNFDISVNGYSIIGDFASQKRLIKLFKYFLIHKDIKLLPEKIVEDLWGDEEFKNPLNMLRTQISRLRKIADIKGTSIEPFFEIRYVNGYYIFVLEKGCVVDFIKFEEILGGKEIDIKENIRLNPLSFTNILLSYKGGLLQELGDEDWLIPIRSRFARLYVKALLYYIDYLKENTMYSEIVDIGEKATKIMPYEESIHLNFMEALVKQNQHYHALMHYEIFTRKLFNDLGVMPSRELKELYKEIRIKDDGFYSNIDLNKIDEEMTKDFNFRGVVFCDIEYFKFIYNYEMRNKNRSKDTHVGIGIITLESKGYQELTQVEAKEGIKVLKDIFMKHLRFGDIVSKWNDNQMLILLYGLEKNSIKVVADKINKQFDLVKIDENLSLNIKINIL